MPKKMLLNTREASERTGVPPEILRSAVRRGDLPAVVPNQRVYLFDPDDLDEWLASVRKGA